MSECFSGLVDVAFEAEVWEDDLLPHDIFLMGDGVIVTVVFEVF